MFLFGCNWSEIDEDPARPPRLLVTVDVEEEFNWGRPFTRQGHTIRSIRPLRRLESICLQADIRPIHCVGYPVVEDIAATELLRESIAEDRCIIGAHLHPWVTPPFDDALDNASSFPGNLEARLESAKIGRLTERIEAALAVRPRTYRAGRYGLGPNTVRSLLGLGYRSDLSAIAELDLRSKSGPDFRRVKPRPYRLAVTDGTIEAFPVTRGHLGVLRDLAPRLPYAIGTEVGRWPLGGLLRRFGLLDRCTLTPEQPDTEEQIKLARRLYDSGTRTFCMTLHSTSLVPGATPYATTEVGVTALLDRLKRFTAFFVEQLGGIGHVPDSVKHEPLPVHRSCSAASLVAQR